MSTKTKLRLIFGGVLTAVIVYFSIRALRDLHPAELHEMHVNWVLVVLSILIFMFANYIRALAYTRGIDREIDRMTAFQIVGIGHAANMILPLRAGEGLRWVFFPHNYTARQRTEMLIVPALGDFVVIMVIALSAVPFAGFRNPLLLRALWILFFAFIGGCVLCVVLVALVPFLRRYVMGYMHPGMLRMMCWITLSWLLLLASMWVGLIAYGFGVWRSVRLALAAFAATNIISFIPASPGGIGLFEYGMILGLGGLGIGQGEAIASGLLLHFIQYAALLPLGGALYLIALHGQYGEDLRAMWHKKK